MIDHVTFQVLDDVTAASSSSKETGCTPDCSAASAARGAVVRLRPGLPRLAFPRPDHRARCLTARRRHCHEPEPQPAELVKTALPDTWTAPIGAARRTALLTRGHMSASKPTGSLARWLTSVTLSSHGRKEPGRCGLPCHFSSVSALFWASKSFQKG